MIHLNPTNLIAVPVPEDANSIEDTKADGFMWQIPDGSYDSFYFEDESAYPYSILGTVTKDTIDFDPTPFVEKVKIRVEIPQRAAGFLDSEQFRNYAIENQYGNSFLKPDKSFRSLLSANEAYFENPYREEPQITTDTALTEIEKYHRWQTAQSKVNDKYVILQKI